ncbi:unnamed protein product [Dicrocoelium dendriticum]|nr:unnamed protein product [Dicrocoelium dendriticum]
MEYGNVCSYGARIGDLPKLFANQIPKEFFILNENDAQALVNDSLSKLSSNPEIHKQLQADCRYIMLLLVHFLSIDSLFVEDEHITLEGILKVVPNRDSTLMPLKTLEYLDSTPGTTDADRSPCYLFGRIPKPEVDLSYKNIAEESPESTEVLQDVFVTVMIYRPTCLPLLDISTQVRNLSATQRIVLLGSQKLSDLKDAIRCPQDKVWLGDCSDALDDPVLHIPAEKLYKSSYFFIENTFYDDLRHPENHKLSKTLLEWIRSKTEFNSMGTFTSSSMDTAVLNDLIIFPGKPYYYVHQGNCEHLVIFSDIRKVGK